MRSFAKVSTFAHVSALGLLAGALGCAAPTPPATPSWDQDVYPIIRGSCSHCHGEASAKLLPLANPMNSKEILGFPTYRFDVCDPTAMQKATGVSFGKDSVGTDILIQGANSPATSVLMVADIDASKGRPKMPPPPAATLSDYEATVLRNWASRIVKLLDSMGDLSEVCKKQGPNHDPKAKLIGTRKDGNDLIATIEITDPDDDQVFAHVTAGAASGDILASGRHDVTLTGAGTGDKIAIKMSDGYGAAVEQSWTQ